MMGPRKTRSDYDDANLPMRRRLHAISREQDTEILRLKAKLADREKRIRLARIHVEWLAKLTDGNEFRAIKELLSLRRPLSRRTRGGK